jgi:hypothetical protein
MTIIREFKYEGEDPRFKKGKFYTYRNIADITGLSYDTVRNRLYKDEVLTDKAIQGHYHTQSTKGEKRKQAWPRLETKADFMSQERLRRPLL